MTRKVKIYGAGSIGNHLANASRKMGWDVVICDVDEAALKRTQFEIYPSRYGKWDDAIKLCKNEDAPKGGFDLIVIGTPPHVHIPLALQAVEEKPKAVLIEKPLCPPDMAGLSELMEKLKINNVKGFIGYDHVVGYAAEKVVELIREHKLGTPETIDVEFREHWGGIFAAHPWLNGPQDSYLGFWKKGGGALGEHSHALNFWIFLAHLTDFGKITEVSAMMDFVKTDLVDYDKIALLNLKTAKNLSGRVVQDVVTKPTRKWGRVQWANSFLEWHAGIKPGYDAVFFHHNRKTTEYYFEKTRPEDFIQEMKYIDLALNTNQETHLDLHFGVDTMYAIDASYRSALESKTIKL